jgi:hypothetical protein
VAVGTEQKAKEVEVRVLVEVLLRDGVAVSAYIAQEHYDEDRAVAIEGETWRDATDDETDAAEEYVEEKLDTLNEVAFESYSGAWSWADAKARMREAFVGRGFNSAWREFEALLKESYERGLAEGRRRR